MGDPVRDIESAFVAQWSLFGRWPGGELHDDGGLVWFETPIRKPPYNGVIRTRIPEEDDPDGAIAHVIDRYRRRGVDFMWIDHPTARPTDLGERLAGHGLTRVEMITGMTLSLDDWEPPPPPEAVVFEEVTAGPGLEDYTRLTLEYWEIEDKDQRELVGRIHNHWNPRRAPGDRFLARLGGRPVGKAYLSRAGPEGVASIYGMSVLPEARRRGIAQGLTAHLLKRAKERGFDRVVLHSTEMAVPLYANAGFEPKCSIDVYATGSLWSGEH